MTCDGCGRDVDSLQVHWGHKNTFRLLCGTCIGVEHSK